MFYPYCFRLLLIFWKNIRVMTNCVLKFWVKYNIILCISSKKRLISGRFCILQYSVICVILCIYSLRGNKKWNNLADNKLFSNDCKSKRLKFIHLLRFKNHCSTSLKHFLWNDILWLQSYSGGIRWKNRYLKFCRQSWPQ